MMLDCLRLPSIVCLYRSFAPHNLIQLFFNKDLEVNLINRIKGDDETQFSPDEIQQLNYKIPPYRKGTSQITCLSAISLINR